MSTSTELYEQAIDKLENYRENEPDQGKRDIATEKIRQYHVAIQQANFDEFSQRTARLEALRADLQEIIASSSGGEGLSDTIADLTNFVGEIATAITETSSGSRDHP